MPQSCAISTMMSHNSLQEAGASRHHHEALLKTFDHHRHIVPRGLRGPLTEPPLPSPGIMLRGLNISDNRWTMVIKMYWSIFVAFLCLTGDNDLSIPLWCQNRYFNWKFYVQIPTTITLIIPADNYLVMYLISIKNVDRSFVYKNWDIYFHNINCTYIDSNTIFWIIKTI